MTMREDENNSSAEPVSADSILLNADILSDEFDDDSEEGEEEAAGNKPATSPVAVPQPLADPLAISISIDEERPKYKTEEKKKEFVDFVERPPICKKITQDVPEKKSVHSWKKRKPLFGADLNQPMNSERRKKPENISRLGRDAFGMKIEADKADEKKSVHFQSPLQKKEPLRLERRTNLSAEKKNSVTAEKKNSVTAEKRRPEKAEKKSEKKDQTGMQIQTRMRLHVPSHMQKRIRIESELSRPESKSANKSFFVTESALLKRGNPENRIKKEPLTSSCFDSVQGIQNLNLERKKKTEDVFLMTAPKKNHSEQSSMDFMQSERKRKSDGSKETDMMRIKNER